MGLFSRQDPDKELARRIVTRGVRVRGTIVEAHDDGERWSVTVRFAPEGAPERTVVVGQRFAPQNAVGLEAGEPVELSYDREDPGTVLIWGNPRYRVTHHGAVVRDAREP